ncbi:hypothetical protein ACP8HI_10660 [Paenibacillus sp. FA6]|uniref:hypothetical protein n=1 Tax=Paenibacillus sp. FA6 TaxID=3413029 RepID=UPI003F65744C
MTPTNIFSSEWLRYKRSLVFYLYIASLIGIPFLFRWIKAGANETILFAVITLTITVLASTELARLAESGILRTILLSNVARTTFYVSHTCKYIVFFIFSTTLSMVIIHFVALQSLTLNLLLKQCFIYFVLTFFYLSFSQLLSILLRQTVQALMSGLLILYIIVPIFNSFFYSKEWYHLLPFLYLEPDNFLALESSKLVYISILLIACSLLFQYLGIRRMQKIEV